VSALPPVPGVVKVTLKQLLGSDLDCLNRFFIAYTGTAPTNATIATFAASVAANWATDIKSLASANVELVLVDCEDLTSSTAAVGSSVAATLGTRAGVGFPAATCALLNLHIARRYRGGKPRHYMPWGVTADINTVQTWSAGFIAAAKAGWDSFMTANEAAVWAGGTITGEVNVSYYEGFTNVPYGTPTKYRRTPTLRVSPLVDAVQSVTCNQSFASQRRRNRP
jgi:hypothetical protein